MLKSYTFSGNKQGNHVLILGAVHGNETAGTQAQNEIIRQLEEKSLFISAGKVTFVPIVNEAAYQLNQRFVDENLNRVVRFHQNPKNNEEKIANQLIKLIDECDVMLDLHSTHCPNDQEFAFIDYPDEKNNQLLALIPVQTALAGWPQIYANQPEITNYCTEEYAHQKGKRGITVECGYHKSEKAIEVAKQSILNVLTYFGNIQKTLPTFTPPKIITLDSFIIKEAPGSFTKDYQHLNKVKEGEIIAVYENGQTIKAPFDGFIIMPNPEAALNTEWFYLGK